jgi:hypothetical protein
MSIYDKNAIEFATVAAEMCHFLENARLLDKQEFLNRSLKMLPLLYLKVSLVEKPEALSEEELEDFVTEDAYEYIRQEIAALLEEDDRYLEVFSPDIQLSDEPLATDISEDLADIYQDLKNFLERYQIGLEEIMNDALLACITSFEEYWGQRLVNCLRAIHNIYFNPDKEEKTDVEPSEEKSFRDNLLSHQL